MKTDTEVTEVIFRKDKEGIYALMPYEISNYFHGLVTCYQHIGQHSQAEYFSCIAKSKPAKKGQYTDLLNELISIGYNVKPITRINLKKYIEAVGASRKAHA